MVFDGKIVLTSPIRSTNLPGTRSADDSAWAEGVQLTEEEFFILELGATPSSATNDDLPIGAAPSCLSSDDCAPAHSDDVSRTSSHMRNNSDGRCPDGWERVACNPSLIKRLQKNVGDGGHDPGFSHAKYLDPSLTDRDQAVNTLLDAHPDHPEIQDTKRYGNSTLF